jgi:hypothetical protein
VRPRWIPSTTEGVASTESDRRSRPAGAFFATSCGRFRTQIGYENRLGDFCETRPAAVKRRRGTSRPAARWAPTLRAPGWRVSSL